MRSFSNTKYEVMELQNPKPNPAFDPGRFEISTGIHRGKNVIWLKFDYDSNLIKMLRSHTKARWSRTQKSWYVLDNTYNRNLCHLKQKVVGKQVLTKISDQNLPEFQKFQNMLSLKGYAPGTIRTYSVEFAQLLYVLKDYPVQDLPPERLQSYFLYCAKELKLSESQIHSRINAVKFYYEQVLHREKMFFDIPRPKKPLALPKILNIKEVQSLFAVTDNLKHRLILMLCYGMGLRVSEIVHLKIEDVDSTTMSVFIRRGKGKKDRYVNLPHAVLDDLRKYNSVYAPKKYLFEGQQGGQYSIRSAQLVFKNAMKKAGIHKKIGIHGLRHSYATHLLELGTDISLIQKLLGHNNVKTTMLYTHVGIRTLSTVKSPLDRLSETPKRPPRK